MEIYLVRHTAPEIEKGICYGQSDIPVLPSFESEAIEIQKQLPEFEESFTIYSSPLTRCKQLADFLFPNRYTTDDRLMELNFGNWEMQKWDDIKKEELNVWMKDFVNESCPNGESYVQLFERSKSFLEDLRSQNKEKVIIVSHAGCMRAIISHINGIPLDKSFEEIKLSYGSVCKLKL